MCNDAPCPDWSAWTPWTQCTVSCGGGTQRRSRDCVAARYGGEAGACSGAAEEVAECGTSGCPAFSPWSQWSPCSATCGGGARSRERHCQADGEEVRESLETNFVIFLKICL